MSDELQSNNKRCSRYLRCGEKVLLKKLGKGTYLEEFIDLHIDSLKVFDSGSGGARGLLFTTARKNIGVRKLCTIIYRDQDSSNVYIDLNVDSNGMLLEIDFWKEAGSNISNFLPEEKDIVSRQIHTSD